MRIFIGDKMVSMGRPSALKQEYILKQLYFFAFPAYQEGVSYTGLFFKKFTRSSSPQFLFLSFDANYLKIEKNMNFAKNSGFARHKSGQNY